MSTSETLSHEFSIRHLSVDDLSALTRLLIAAELAEFGETEQTEERVRAGWMLPGFHLETDSWGVFAKGRLVASASVDQQEYVRYYADTCVHPEYCGRGLGTYLLHIMDAWIAERLHLAPEGARITSHVGTNHTNRAAQQLFAHEGYQPIRRFWRMRIDLAAAPPAPIWTEGISVRTYIRGQDDHPVFEMSEEAFQDHWGFMPSTFEEWDNYRLKREIFDPTLWFLACAGDELVGGALCRQEPHAAIVGQLAVRRPWRRLGIGMALLLHAFGEFYRRGTSRVELGVDSQNLTGATRLYERAGMHVFKQFIAFEKELRPGQELSTQTLE